MMPACGVVTLTTDFGIHDSYVGTMKGVILRIHPEVRLIDISHRINPQDILEASLVLDSAYRFFPAGAVHVAVVDPGVGGKRKPMILCAGEHYFVGPDNGIFTRVLEAESDVRAFEIREPAYLLPNICDTFHGRDIFSPVAAYLARGVDPASFGPALGSPMHLELASPRIWEDEIRGEVIHIDSFGNILSNIANGQFAEVVKDREFRILINGKSIGRLCRTYEEQERGRTLALFGSSGLLEIAVAEGRADRRIGASKGDTVLVQIYPRPREAGCSQSRPGPGPAARGR